MSSTTAAFGARREAQNSEAKQDVTGDRELAKSYSRTMMSAKLLRLQTTEEGQAGFGAEQLKVVLNAFFQVHSFLSQMLLPKNWERKLSTHDSYLVMFGLVSCSPTTTTATPARCCDLGLGVTVESTPRLSSFRPRARKAACFARTILEVTPQITTSFSFQMMSTRSSSKTE